MNWEQIEGNWNQASGYVQKQWGKLTDDDLDEINGQRQLLIGKIQAVYGVSEEEAERQLDAWLAIFRM